MFKGFKPQGLQKIANRMGYTGSMQGFNNYLQQNPDKQNIMNMYNQGAMQMARGGVVRRMREGGVAGGGGVNPNSITNAQVGGEDGLNKLPSVTEAFGEDNPLPVAKTLMAGEDDPNMGNFEGRLPGPETQRIGEDGSGSMPIKATTMAAGEEGGMPFLPNRPPDKATTMAVGEEDGSGGGGLKTLAFGEENGIIRPDPRPVGATRAMGEDGTGPRPSLTRAVGEDGNWGDARYTTMAVGEEDGSGGMPSVTQAVGEDGSNDAIATTLAEGEEAGSGPPPGAIYGGAITRAIGEDGSGGMPIDPRVLPQANVPTTTGFVNEDGTPSNIGNIGAQQMIAPTLPVGGTTIPVGTQVTSDQIIDPNVGQVSGTVSVPTSMATTTNVTTPEDMTASTMTAATVSDQVDTALNATQAAQLNPDDPRSQVNAAQQTASSVGNLSAAQGNATLMSNPVQRQVQDGELVSGAANAETASTYAEQIQAATATPSEKATVQGQLANLTANFDASNPPAWAAGSLRAVQAQMAARGLGASSMAGQAMIQGALESALPIAQADAQVMAQFEVQNLSNRQQRAMLAAQQRAVFIGQEFDQAFQARVANASRIGDIANMNFTAEQQIGLENSRAVNTMNLSNLSNTQAMTMAEASALSQLDMSNLNNRQQAAVQNANSFLQTEMANTTNLQQTNLFKAQQRTQSLFTDQAAENASRQFNATSQAQTDQFFANLSNQAAQYNATQSNAQAQFNAGQANTVERFNAELNNQRDQFNAQNQTVIAQSNATWRREIATADTVAVNRANELNANAILGISKTAYDNLWTHYGDTMEWAWTSAENELDRIAKITTAEISAEASIKGYEMQADAKAASGLGSMIGTVLSAGSNSLVGSWFGACWVAREIYGKTDPRWVVFRMWLDKDSPAWFKKLYIKHGEAFAEYIKDRPILKKVVKYFMDIAIDRPTQYLKGKKDADLQTSK